MCLVLVTSKISCITFWILYNLKPYFKFELSLCRTAIILQQPALMFEFIASASESLWLISEKLVFSDPDLLGPDNRQVSRDVAYGESIRKHMTMWKRLKQHGITDDFERFCFLRCCAQHISEKSTIWLWCATALRFIRTSTLDSRSFSSGA